MVCCARWTGFSLIGWSWARACGIVNGEITDASFVGLLEDFVAKFADWIARLRSPALTF